MLDELKKIVFDGNIELVRRNLVIYTWGNVSGIDKESGLFAIKPSGVDYDTMKFDDMVVLDLEGNKKEGKYKPSSDTATHIELYKAFPEIGAVVHTHSSYAASWAQARKDIKAFGTTHADYFYGDIPCARALTKEEIESDYEKNTGLVIIETLKERKINPMDIPGIILSSHGPFAWGKDVHNAVHNAVVLEEVAKMAYRTIQINPDITRVEQYLLDKHYFRKHGKNSYYGQN
ncbi:L-ribulose-5-phosphate 4-epimerase [Brachyspira innocens]|uniref:L-ribulose-5-phosphate 4-epimerase n=1 Tax=Brachyspira innocens TaxID=13264 RepID=A0ABT8YUT8_9SPIR|nr:L-ribulose-5-phosphate 4-epimerase [Brachyspira innocens]MDO6993174.1 L-ribulose-5-phosphate 4-epimerase [Brachyspira innocens]MDO7019657.1 L-ribulose-5-phosphate 4-epimerase [Brachyspira innocens]